MGENLKDMSKVAARRKAPLETPTDLGSNAVKDLAPALTALLADVFALYVKTKNFHWHMSGPHFRDYHLLLDEQSDQIFAMTDPAGDTASLLKSAGINSIVPLDSKERIKQGLLKFLYQIRQGCAPVACDKQIECYSRKNGAFKLAQMLESTVCKKV